MACQSELGGSQLPLKDLYMTCGVVDADRAGELVRELPVAGGALCVGLGWERGGLVKKE